MKDIQILASRDYFAEITQTIATTKPGDRIALTSMTFNPLEPLIDKLMVELQTAALRGVTVHILPDARSFMVDAQNKSTGPLLHNLPINEATHPEFKEKYIRLNRIEQVGGHYAVINQPRNRFTLPAVGRSHIKAAIINNDVYIGGCNLSESEQIDFMAHVTDRSLADWLFDLLVQTESTGSIRKTLQDADHTIKLDSRTHVFVDAGRRNRSLILEQALQLIDEAKEHLLITCQFFPNSITASHLERARRRGVKVTVYFNHPGHQTKVLSTVQRAVLLGERLRVHRDLFINQLPADHGRIHAKILASEKSAMIGSHNYVRLGVRLGTAEIALRRDRPEFARQVIQTIRPYIGAGA